MTVTRTLFATLIAIIVIVGGVFFLSESVQEDENKLFSHLGVEHYQLSYKQKVFNFSLSATPTPSYTELKAELFLRIVSITPEKVEAVVQLRDVELVLEPKNTMLSDALSEYYARSVRVIFGADGEMVSVLFPGLEENYAGYRQMLKQIEVRIDKKAEYRWLQHDALGRYYGEYTRSKQAIIRRKSDYIVDDKARRIDTYLSKAEVILDSRTNWYKTLDMREKLRLFDAGKKLLQTETNIAITHLDSDVHEVETVDDEQLQETVKEDNNLFEEVENRQAQRYFDRNGLDLEALLKTIVLDPDTFGNYEQLERYLRLNPEKIAELYDVLISSSDKVSRNLIAMLESLQLPQSQSVLSTMATDVNVVVMNRTRALIALSGQEKATQEVVSVLQLLNEDRSGPEAVDLANTALLALGSISRNDPGIGLQNRYVLENTLESARSYGEKKTALLAIKNAGIKPFTAQLLEFVSDKDLRLRRLSVEMFIPYSDDEEVREAMQSQLQSEEDEDLKEVLQNALDKSNQVSQ